MPRQGLALAILGASVLALVALQVVTQQRLSRLSEQLAKLEERPGGSAGAPAAGEGTRAAGVGTPDVGGGATGRAAPGSGPDAGPAPAEGGKAGGGSDAVASRRRPAHAEGALSAEEVEKLIDAKLAERDKKNPFVQLMNYEDPLTVMEKELKLSPIQKTRIAEHIKERDDATMALWQDPANQKDFKGTNEKAEDLRKTCEESVKRELDLAQQDKYEELKKSGKLVDWGGGGVSIMVGGKSGDDGNGAAPEGK